MTRTVLKFGGTSVASPTALDSLAKIVAGKDAEMKEKYGDDRVNVLTGVFILVGRRVDDDRPCDARCFGHRSSRVSAPSVGGRAGAQLNGCTSPEALANVQL